MFELFETTRTVAILCGFSAYDAPSKAPHRQLQSLERVEPTLQRLQALLSSEQFVAVGIQAFPLLNHSKSELLERLDWLRQAVRERPGVNMVVFWSGHGNVHEKSFRLAVRNTCEPIEYEDGVGLDEVLRQSGVARVGTWTLFLDACYAGEGLSDVMDGAHDLLKSEAGKLRGYGALCSSAPFEKSRDSAFLDTVVGVLESGPSAAVRTYAESEGGGGRFNPFNKLLSLGELFDAVCNEYRADPGKYRRAEPWPMQGGPNSPRLFPNPQWHERQPSRLAESAFRPIARAPDFETHFFPKALGIDNLESGWHFAGRVEATRAILIWMARPPNLPVDRLYVLTADGGTGKSALLGRLIALTDRHYRDKAKAQGWNQAHDQQAGTVPEPDRIDAAFSLRDLTTQTLAQQLAGLLETGPFDSVEACVENAVQSYRRPDGRAPCLVLDALDEANEPLDIAFRIIIPMVKAGWKMLVATRRTAKAKGANDLVGDLGAATVFELDRDAQSWSDIYVYARDRLQQHVGPADLTEAAAKLIADRAHNKFLFARIATSSLLRKTDDITLDRLSILVAQDATDALTLELTDLDLEFRRTFARSDDGATVMLTALAWSEGEGAPIRDGIWAALAGAIASLRGLSPSFEERHILWTLREAGRFIQESGDGEQAVYRLFHESLVDHFRRESFFSERHVEAVNERVADALATYVRASRNWVDSNPYLIRHLPAHLATLPRQRWLNQLLLNFDWIQARLNQSGIQALLGDYLRCHRAYLATERLHRTLSMIAHILREHPDQLIPQLLARIAPGLLDITPLFDVQPSANSSLPPPSLERLEMTRNLLQLPDLNIEQRGVDLIDDTRLLDGLLARARACIRSPRWVPDLGGLYQAGALVYTLQGHEGWVTSVALSADGRTVVSGSNDSTIRLWDARTGMPIHTLQGHKKGVSGVSLSADGRTVVSGGYDGTVRLWNTQTGQRLRDLQRTRGGFTSVSLSADGRTVVSGSYDGRVRVWDTETCKRPRTLKGHDDGVGSVALSADGRTVVSGGNDGTVRLWDAQTGKLLRLMQGHVRGSVSVALSADGRKVVTGGDDGMVNLWDTQTRMPLWTLKGDSRIPSVSISADGRIVAIGNLGGTVSLWDAQTAEPSRSLEGGDWSPSVALSSDGSTVVSGGRDNRVCLWDAGTDEPLPTRQGHDGWVRSVALSVDGRTVVSGGNDSKVRVWDAQTGKLLQSLEGHEREVTSVALSADGRTLASGSRDEQVRLWDPHTGRLMRTLQGSEFGVTSLALSADGDTLVFGGSYDRQLSLVGPQTQRDLQGHEGKVTSVALSADGRTVVSGGEDSTVRLWDTHTGKLLHTLQGHKGAITSVTLSGNGRTAVSASGGDNLVRLWDVQAGQPLGILEGHKGLVLCVALSADGHTVVCGGEDRTVRWWSTHTGQVLETLTLDADVTAVALAKREGQSVMFVASGNSVLRLTRVPGVPAVATSGP